VDLSTVRGEPAVRRAAAFSILAAEKIAKVFCGFEVRQRYTVVREAGSEGR
jgi:hypothetical protein